MSHSPLPPDLTQPDLILSGPLSRDHRPFVVIDTGAIVTNYIKLRDRAPGITIACIIKADAYGLGSIRIGQTLYEAGCRHFFVAYAFEGACLREHVGEAEIFVFHGPSGNTLKTLKDYRLTPVLNSIEQINLWKENGNAPAAVHLDTGLNRLGLPEKDAAVNALFDGLTITTLISHLSHGGIKDEARNAAQYKKFKALVAKLAPVFPSARLSFKASAGIFSPLQTHEQIYRAGISLYGGSPYGECESALRHTASLYAPVLEVQNIPPGKSVGYNGTYTAQEPRRIATLGIGYADGFKRKTDEQRMVFLKGAGYPVIGTVSMDLTTIDITACKQNVTERDYAEIFGANIPLDEAANKAGTIGYELLTTMGTRVKRYYI